MAFLRTISSAGFIPFSYEGIIYDAEVRDNERLTDDIENWLKPVYESEKSFLNNQRLDAIDDKIADMEFRMDTGEFFY